MRLDVVLRSDQQLDALAAGDQDDRVDGDPALSALRALVDDACADPPRQLPHPAYLHRRATRRHAGRTAIAAGVTAAVLAVTGAIAVWGGLLDPLARAIGVSHRAATSELTARQALERAHEALAAGRPDEAARYAEIARKRWRQMTGENAELAGRIADLETRLPESTDDMAGTGMTNPPDTGTGDGQESPPGGDVPADVPGNVPADVPPLADNNNGSAGGGAEPPQLPEEAQEAGETRPGPPDHARDTGNGRPSGPPDDLLSGPGSDRGATGNPGRGVGPGTREHGGGNSPSRTPSTVAPQPQAS